MIIIDLHATCHLLGHKIYLKIYSLQVFCSKMSCKEISEEEQLETFQRWGVVALKAFLKLRGLQTTHNKNELSALAFAAHYFKLPLKLTQEEKENILFEQYKDLLSVDGVKYSDPISEIKIGWVAEKEGMKLWPPTMYYDVCQFLLNDTKGPDLAKRVFKDYKEKKGFSFLSSGFLFEILYNTVSDDCDMCFLKADCRPSMRIHDIPHTAWVMIEKKSGEIKRAYCTCIAGRGQSCLHVTAILMKVDVAWKFGLTHPSCTSTECGWIKKPQLILPPSRVCDMDIKSPKYLHPTKNINSSSKQLFQPHKHQKGKPFSEFLSTIKKIVPDAVVFSESEERPIEKRIRLEDSASNLQSTTLPRSVIELAKQCDTVNDLKCKLLLECEGKLEQIECETTLQAKSPVWLEQRKGRITASNFKDVFTKYETLERKGSLKSTTDDPLIKRLIGQTTSDLSNIKAIKHGINCEGVALQEYITFNKGKHQNPSYKSSGLIIDSKNPHIAASPDQIISCDCHGEGLLEIKCPWSASYTVPSPSSCAYLHEVDNIVKLKTNHKYYYQIQGQMGVAGVKYCDFWVFTYKGHHLETIEFDEEFWKNVINSIDNFWTKYVAPILIASNGQLTPVKVMQPIAASTPSTSRESLQPIAASTPSTSQESNNESAPVIENGDYECGVCGCACKGEAEIKTYKDYSIGCDLCGKWFHLPCIKLNRKSKELKWPQWFCKNCK